jgi:hypothetical protein
MQQDMVKVLLGKSKKPVTILDEECEEFDARELSAIHIFLVDDVMFNIFTGTKAVGLWMKMESLYKKKSLMNKIFLKR